MTHTSEFSYNDQGQRVMITRKGDGHGNTHESTVLLQSGRRTTRNLDILLIEREQRQELRENGETDEIARRNWAVPLDERVEQSYLKAVGQQEFALPGDVTEAARRANALAATVDG